MEGDLVNDDLASSLDASVELEYWSKEADRILSAYREEHQREISRRPASKKQSLNIIMELSFQLACHWTVILLVPHVHPRIVQWDQFVSRTCGLMPGLFSPTRFQMCLTAFSAKVLVGALFSHLPFSNILRATQQLELVPPTSARGLELSFLATLAGILPPYAIAAARRTLSSKTFLFVNSIFQMACMPLAGITANGLCTLCLEAQASGSLATLVAFDALQRLACLARSRSIRSLCALLGLSAHVVGQNDDELVCWEGQRRELGETPSDMLCPITTQLFVHPRLLHGMAYEAAALRRWLQYTHRHPTLQGLHCSIYEIKKAPELEVLCHKFAHSRGFTLSRQERSS